MSESGVAVIANIENACFPLGLSAVKACHAGVALSDISNSDMMNEALGTVTSMKRPLTDEEDIDVAEVKKLKLVEGVEPDSVVNGKGSIDEESVIDKVSAIDAELAVAETNAKTNGKEDKEVAETKDDNDAKANGNDVELIEADMQDGPSEKESDLNDEGQTNNAEAQTKTEEGANSSADVEIPEAKLESNVNSSTNLIASSDSLRNDPPNDVNIPNDLCDNSKDTDVTLAPSNNAASVNSPDGTNCEKTDLASVRTHVEPDEKDKLDENDSIKPHEKDSSKPIEKESNSHVREDTPDSPTNGDISINTHSTDLLENIQHIESSSSSPSNENTVQLKTNCDLNSEAKTDTNGEAKESSFDDPEKEDKEDDDSFTISIHKILEESDSEIKCDDSVYSKPTEVGDQSIELEEEAKILCDDVKPVVEVQESKEDIKEEIIEDVPIVEEIKSTNLVKDEIEDLVSTDKEDTKLRIEAVDNEDLVVADKGDLKDKVTVSTKEEIEEEKPSVVDIEISTVDKPVDVKLDNTPQTNNLTEPDKKSTESVEKQSNAIEQTDIEIGEIKSPLKSSANDTCLNSDKLEPSISPSEEDVIPTDASKPDMDNISCMDAEMEDSSSEKVETVKSEAVSENMNTEDPKNDEGSRSKPCDEELDSDISEEPKAKKIKLDVENDVEMVSTSNKDSVIDGSNENITKTAITEPDVELIDLDKEQKDEIKKSSPESTPIVESTSESEVTSKLEESPVAQPIESQKLDEIGTINDETSIKPSKISETITINDELEENSESLQTNQSNDEKSAKESLDNLQAINSAPENVATRDSVTAEIQESVVNTSEKADQNKSKDTSNLEVNKDSTIPSNQENEEKKEADKESTQQPESIKQTEPVEVTKNETVADKILENSSQIVKESINDDIELIENSATQIDDKPKDILNDLSEKDQSSGDTAHVEETKTDTSADGSQKSDQPSEANAVLDSEVKPTEDSTKKKDVEKLIEETATKNTDTTSNKDSTSEDKSPELSEVVGDTDATVDKILEEIDETLKENEVSLDADIEKDEGKLLEETEPNVGPEESTEEKADKGKTDDAEDAEMLSLVIDEKTDSDVELIELPDDEKTKEMDTTKPQETEKEPLNEAAKKVIDIEMEIDNATSILNESPEKTSQSAIRPEIELEMDDALSSLNGSPNKTAQPANEATVETTEKKTDDKNEDDDDIVFIKCCKRGLEKLLSRTFLKYFAYESEVGKLRELLGKLQVENATIKTLCLTQAKQLKELGHVHDKAVEEIRAYRGEDKGLPLAPVKITRSVGLQVNVVVAEKKRTGPGTYSRSVASLKRDQRARNAPRTPTASPGAWSSPPNKTSPGTSPRVGVPRAVVPVQRKSLPVPGLTPRAGRPVSARPMTPSPTGGLRILPPRAVNAAIRSPGVRQVNLGRVITRAPMIRTTGVSHNVPPGTSISVKPSGVETINLDDDDAGNAPRNNIKIVRSARGPSTPIRLTTAPTSMANNKIQPGSPRLAYVPISQGYKLRPATGTTGSILTTLPNTSTATTTTYVLETSAGLIPFQTNNVRLNLKPNATASQPVKLNYLGGNGSRLQTGSNEEAASVANEVQVSSNEVTEEMHVASNEVTEVMHVASNEVTEEMPVPSNEVTEVMHVASNEVTEVMHVASNEVTEEMPVPSNEVTEGMPVPSNEVTEGMPVPSNEVTEGMPVEKNGDREEMNVETNEVTGKTIEKVQVISNEVTKETNKEIQVASIEEMPVPSNAVTEETIEELQVVLNKEIQVSSIEDIQVSNGEMQVASDEEKEETREDVSQVVFNEVIQVVSNGEAEQSIEGIQVSSDEDIIQVVFNEIIQQVVSNGEIDETNEDIYVLSSEETLSVSSDDSEVEITHVSNFTRNGTPGQIPTNEEIASNKGTVSNREIASNEEAASNEGTASNESASFVNTQSALNEDTQSVTNKETDVLSSEKASQSVLTGKSPSNMLDVTQPCKFFTLNSEIKRTFLKNLLKEEAAFSDLVEANCAKGCVSAVEDKGEECSNVAMSSDSRSVTDRFCGLDDLEKECPCPHVVMSSELSSVTDGSCDFKDLVEGCPNPDVSFEEVEVLSDAFDSDKCGSPYDEDVEICGPPPGSFSDLYDSPFAESSANVNRSACVLRGVKEELIASCVVKTEPVESILGSNFEPLVVISGDVLNTEDFRKNQEISEEFTKLEARRKSVAKGKKVEKAHPKILDTNQHNRGEIFDLDLCTPKSDVTAGTKSPHVRLKKVYPSGKKIVRTKGRIHFCIFCKKNVPPQFSKHLFMMHKEEPQVEAILKLDPTDAIRKWLMSKIRMEGDMANRIERNSNGMMKSGRHQKEPESRLMKAKRTARIRKVETVECPYCKRKLRGNLKRHIRRRHLRFKTQVAGFVEDNTSQREGQTTVNFDQENHREKAHENSRKTEQRSNTSTDDIEKIDALPTLLTNTQHCKENEHTLATSLEEYAMDNAVLEQAVPRNFQQPNTEKNVRKESRSFYCILCKKTVKRFSRHLEFSHRKHPQVKAIMGLDSTNISRKRVISKLRIQGDLILRNSNMFHRVKGTRTPCPYCTINYAQKALPNHIKKCAFRDTSEEASENNGHPKENTSQGKIIEEKEKEHTEKASDDNGEMVNDASEGGKSFDESSKAAAPTLEDRLFAENSENESGKANNTSVNSSGDNEHADDDLTLGELWSKRLANIENRKGEELKNGNGEEIVNVSGGYITKENIAEINKDSEEKINKVSDVKISKGKRIKIRKDHTKNMCNDKGKKNTYTKKGTRDNVRKYNRKKVNVDNLDKASKDNRDYVNKNYEAKLSKKNVDTSNTNNEESIDNDETKSNTSDTEEFTESLTLADRVKIRRPNSDLEVSKYSRQKTSYNGEKTSYNGEKTSTRICNDEETCTESCTIEKTRTMNCNVQKNHNMSCNNGEEIKVTQGKMNQYNETSDSSSDEFTEASLKAGRIKRYRASPDPEYIPRNRLHGSQKRLRPSSPDPEYLPKVRLHGQQPRRRASNANPEYVPTNSSHEPKQRRRPNKTPRIPCNWTPEQRNAVVDHFSEHIRLKKLPSKLECQTLIDRDFPLFVDKTAWNVKVLVQNIRSGLYRRELDRAKASGQL
ncbi:hypothetical protein M8J75_003656 [Diaphorina citri]|nr:hypothetical protein M8J75_003656 [Diaphorina citri]